MLRFRNGIIKPFLDTKHLSFTHEPFGEEKSKQGISDDLVNQRLSVFSIEAVSYTHLDVYKRQGFFIGYDQGAEGSLNL